MPSVHFVRPPDLAPAPYAHAAVADPGRLVVSAGAAPLDADGATVAVGDVAGQARQVMANLAAALEATGAGLPAVVKTTVYVATTDRADLESAWKAVAAAFGDHEPPSTLVGVTVLGHPDQLVEVEALAVLEEWREPGPPPDEITDDPPPGATSTVAG
ncbi:RidA family protein [Modestobacter sp. NPDC049651]|uniref:RidA family protein n=1 Tax=unclassified Modestobacter TaxID=2643866 RepID=UPI0033E26B71